MKTAASAFDSITCQRMDHLGFNDAVGQDALTKVAAGIARVPATLRSEYSIRTRILFFGSSNFRAAHNRSDRVRCGSVRRNMAAARRIQSTPRRPRLHAGELRVSKVARGTGQDPAGREN